MSVLPGSSYEIRPAKPEDAPAIFDFLVKFFYPEEPLNSCLKRIPSDTSQVIGIRNPQFRQVVGQLTVVSLPEIDFLIGCKANNVAQLGNNISLLAVSQNDSLILGVAVNLEICPDTTEKWIQSAKARHETSDPKLYQLYKLLQTALTKADKDIWPTTEPEFRGLEIHYLAVRREARGQNIGAALTEASVQLARQKGYKLIRATCTSKFSAEVMKKLGFECASTVQYNTFVDSAGEPIFVPQPPHTECGVYVRRLWLEPRSYADSLKTASKRV